MVKFMVTSEIVWGGGDECDPDYSVLAENVGAREAIETVRRTRTNEVGGEYDVSSDDQRVTVYNGMEFRTGEFENRTLHRPKGVTNSSWERICRNI